ncbi:hypothetical protein [Micromonospora sp. NPDC049891]|uniref:hypothetical protein n=1 Tax=Micromonospora sp. NPDC049891 TaxID=3155655 RepID=UPI0033E29416
MADPADVKRLADVNDTIIGVVENGPWVLIEDPTLRRVVGEYVADACHTIASDAGLTEAMEYAHDALPLRLDTTARLVTPAARHRLARYLRHAGDGPSGSADDYLRAADRILNVITGTEN